MKQPLILTVCLLFAISAFGQTTDSIKVKIIGKWTLIKQTIIENNEIKDILTADTKQIYEFKADGTYKFTMTNKFGTCIAVGNWRIF